MDPVTNFTITWSSRQIWCCPCVVIILDFMVKRGKKHGFRLRFSLQLIQWPMESTATVSDQWEFQDPKMEVLYHILGQMVGTFNKSVPEMAIVGILSLKFGGSTLSNWNGRKWGACSIFPKKTIQQSSSFWEDFTTWPCREAPAGSKASTEKAQYCCSHCLGDGIHLAFSNGTNDGC